MNRNLKNVKSEVLVDFIWSDQLGITVVICKVVLSSDFQIIEDYIKNVEYIDITGVNISCFPQLKSYLKIISISYYSHDNQSLCLSSNNIEVIIKKNQRINKLVFQC